MAGKIFESISEFYNYSVKPFHEGCVLVCAIWKIFLMVWNIPGCMNICFNKDENTSED